MIESSFVYHLCANGITCMVLENFQSKFHPVRSTGTYHEKLLGLELTMRIFLVERAHHGLFC